MKNAMKFYLRLLLGMLYFSWGFATNTVLAIPEILIGKIIRLFKKDKQRFDKAMSDVYEEVVDSYNEVLEMLKFK